MKMNKYKAGELPSETEVYLASEVVEPTDYYDLAREAAADSVKYLQSRIVEQLAESEEAIPRLNHWSYGNYHHETHVDKSYSLKNAVELLQDLDEYEETDTGLWEGQEPQEAIKTAAAFTFGNAVLDQFHELIDKINEAYESEVLKAFDEEHEFNIEDAKQAANTMVCRLANEFDPTIND